jgi:cell division protein FtsW (lipid II flippase)
MTAPTVPPSSVSPRRGVELGLTALAVLIAVLAYAAVGLAIDGQIPSGTAGYGAGLGALFLAAHLAVRRVAPYADPLILPAVALLNGLGLVMIRRLDFAAVERATQAARDLPGAEAPRQLVWTAVGIAAFIAVLVLVRDHTRLQRYTYTAAVTGLVLLLLPALPVLGRTINGARLWIRVGPFTLQPSEAAKLLLIVFFAGYLVAKRDVLSLASRRVLGLDLPRARDLGPVLVAWGASLAVLVRGRDLGSSLLFFALFVVMLYIATERTSWLVIGVGLFLGGAYVAYQLFDHVQRRVSIWLDPFADPDGAGFQLVQSLFGFGTGGLSGTGLGEGRPGTVPYASTDFIMAAIGEELGLIGVMAVLLVFGLIVERGLRAALAVRDSFGKLLAAGLSFSLALQVFVIVGGVTGLIPLTGVTLPWLSYGGSSIVANWALVALLLRISDAARRPAPAPVTPDVARAALATAETQVVRRPKGANGDSPKGANGDSPKGANGDSPKGADQDSPKGADQDSPKGADQDSPKGADSPTAAQTVAPGEDR